MRQLPLAHRAEFQGYGKKTRREQFLEEMEAVMPWAELFSLVAPHYSKGEMGRKPQTSTGFEKKSKTTAKQIYNSAIFRGPLEGIRGDVSLHILVIEYERKLADAIAEGLAESGYRVTIAHSGEAGL